VLLYTPEQRQVLSIRPGITGPAQLIYRNLEGLLRAEDPEAMYVREVLPRKLATDLQYVRCNNIVTDTKILFRTLGILVH
jgi:lipopolysaccharide/colanic/teichoic acid biosynthesis glycosyltransferase